MAKILIVDDSAFQRNNVRFILKSGGHVVAEASNGREALEAAAAQAPDCILLDIMMPELDGWEVLTAMRERGLRIPVIMLIADVQDSTRKKCLDLGAVAVIHKPADRDQLLDLIDTVLSSNPHASRPSGASAS